MVVMAATTGCSCSSLAASSGTPASVTGSNTFSTYGGDDSQTNSAETLLSSNARFQAISAIAVSQDGVINVADQGKLHSLFVGQNLLLNDCSVKLMWL